MGGSKAGKSSRLYQMVIERSVAQPDSRLLLIVPEQYTMQTQKRIVALHPGHSVMNVDVLSFERLAYRVFEETGTSMSEILDETGKSMIIRRILSERERDLHAFRGNVRRRGFVEQLRLMISELLQYDISPEILAEKIPMTGADTRLYMKLRDIQMIYGSFMEFIRGRYMTAEELTGVLSDVLPHSEKIRHSAVFMDNFTGFTPVQYRLMEQLLILSPELVITLCNDVDSDPYDASDPDDTFYITRTTVARLEALCRKNHIPRDEDILLRRDESKRAAKADLYCLDEGFFRKKAAAFTAVPEHISLYRAASPDEEMHLAAMKIHELVRDGDFRYSQIAVVASDMEIYLAGAGKWFDRYDIPCFFDSRKPVSGNMLVEWMRSLLEMLRTGMKYQSVFRYLRSGLAPLAREQVDELENYVIAYGIRGAGRWFSGFTAGEKEIGAQKLAELNSMRELVVAPLKDLQSAAGKKNVNAAKLIRLLYGCMQASALKERIDGQVKEFESAGDLDRAKEYEQIYGVMVEILERIYLILGDEQMSLREFSDVLETGIAQIRLGLIPPGMDQVTFGDLRRTRLDDVRVLIFVGVNDGLVPRMAHPAGLITDAEREILSGCEIDLAPTAGENLRTERFYLYSCMTKPSDSLMISYSAQDAAGDEKLPARMIAELRETFPGMKLTLSGNDSSGDVRSAYDHMRSCLSTLSGRSAGEMPFADEQETDRFKKIYRWFINNPRYKERTETLTRAASFRYTGDRLSAAAVKAVYGGGLRGGVTMLEQYAACAYAHFLSYGLHLAERRIYQVEAPDIGSIFHRSIELFSRRVMDSGLSWRDIPDNVRDEWVRDAVLSVVSDYRSNLMQDTGRARYMTERICTMAGRTVWALQQQIKKGDFEPEDCEIRFSAAISSDDLTLLSSGSGTVYLNGRIDRIDCCEDSGNIYLRVIDYKTGRNRFDLSSVYHGLQLQLIVYMNAALQQEKTKRADAVVIPAGVFYYDIDDPMIETDDFEKFISDTDSGDGEYSENDIRILESLAMNGLVLEDEDAIRHLDNAPDLKPRIIPVSYNKDGKLSRSSSTAETENFCLLSEYVDKKSAQIAADVFSGNIDVDPYKYGDKTSCTYCAYRSVCGFSTGIRGFSYRKLSSMKNDEVWAAMARKISKGGGSDGD